MNPPPLTSLLLSPTPLSVPTSPLTAPSHSPQLRLRRLRHAPPQPPRGRNRLRRRLPVDLVRRALQHPRPHDHRTDRADAPRRRAHGLAARGQQEWSTGGQLLDEYRRMQ